MSELITYRLDEIADVIDCEHKTAPKVDSSEYYSIRTPDIKNGRLLYEQANRVSAETYAAWTKRGVPEAGDIILAREAPVGEVGWIDKDHKICLGQRTVLIKIHSTEIDKKYLLYSFVSPKFKDYLNELSGGSVVAHFNMKDIRALEFPFPPLPEQKAIASALSSLDDKIDLLHRQNKTLEAMAETLFRQWFIEEAKEDWQQATLKDEFSFTMGQSPSGSSFNEDSVGTPMFQGNADFGFRFPKERVYTTEPARFAYPLDTLISVRAPVGAQNMAKVECCIGRGVAAFRHAKNPQWYTYTYYKLNQLMNQIKQFNDEGTVFGSISKSDFERLEVVIPPDETVFAYEQTAKPLNDKIIANVEQIQTLENLRDTLLPKLMSGEVRVQFKQESVA